MYQYLDRLQDNPRMKQMHAHMARLYEAAREAQRLSGQADQMEMARLLNVAPQNVNNWEARGPSKDALLEAQATFGVNATWVTTGVGPMFVGGSATTTTAHWPFKRVEWRRFERLNPEERGYVEGRVEAAIESVEANADHQKRIADKRQVG